MSLTRFPDALLGRARDYPFATDNANRGAAARSVVAAGMLDGAPEIDKNMTAQRTIDRDEPEQGDGAGVARLSLAAPDAVLHARGADPIARPLQPACRARRLAGLRDRPPRRHGAVLGVPPLAGGPRLPHRQ